MALLAKNRNVHFTKKPGTLILNETYKVGKRLGNGSYGTVYKARDLKENRNVALKISRSDDRYEANNELKMLIAVKRVPEFVQTLDYFEFDADARRRHKVIVMECHETDLSTVFDREEDDYVWHADNVRKILVQVVKGLVFLHKDGIIHGDIKPENILLVREKGTPPRDLSEHQRHLTVKIADLGLARKAPASGPVQTRSFRAPEVIRRKKYGTAIDIWSLGCMAYLFYAGAAVFSVRRDVNREEQDNIHLEQILHICGYVYGWKSEENGQTKKVEHTYKKFIKLLQELDWIREEAVILADWINGTLRTNPKKRATAEDCLNHPLLCLNNLEKKADDKNAIIAARDNAIEEEESDEEREEDWDEEDGPSLDEFNKMSAPQMPSVKTEHCSRDSDIQIIFEGRSEEASYNVQQPAVNEEIVSGESEEDEEISGSAKNNVSNVTGYRSPKRERNRSSSNGALELRFASDGNALDTSSKTSESTEEDERDSALVSGSNCDLTEEAEVAEGDILLEGNRMDHQPNPRKRAIDENEERVAPKIIRFEDIFS